MKVTIVGSGYVGLVTGTCLAEFGHDVLCVDIDEAKIKALEAGEIPIYEPGLEELVHHNQEQGRLHFTTDIKEGIQFADILFNAVGTPLDKDHNADLSAVKTVARSFGQNVQKHTVFVNKSTVPVGGNQEVAEIIKGALKERDIPGNEAKDYFSIVSNPEFLREGVAIKDFLEPTRIIIGVEDEKAQKIMKKLYQSLITKGYPFFVTDLRSAEIIKYAANAFLATKISFINEIANFCTHVDGNINDVAQGIGLDPRIGKDFLQAGIGYGGSCLPKDVQALIQDSKDKPWDFKILEAVDQVNQDQVDQFLKKIKTVYPELKGRVIAVWGLTFKPNTDDLREAPALKIVSALQKQGAKVQVFDPQGMKGAKQILDPEKIHYGEDLYEVLEGADCLLLLTEWDVFREADLSKVAQKLKTPVLIDGRNTYNRKEVEASGLQYVA